MTGDGILSTEASRSSFDGISGAERVITFDGVLGAQGALVVEGRMTVTITIVQKKAVQHIKYTKTKRSIFQFGIVLVTRL